MAGACGRTDVRFAVSFAGGTDGIFARGGGDGGLGVARGALIKTGVPGEVSRRMKRASMTSSFITALTITAPTPSTRVRHCAGLGPSDST